MPLFGAHMSVAGGLHNAALAARSCQCKTVQLFTKNSNQWDAPALTADQVRAFRRAVKDAGLKYPTAHDSYLINLASPVEALYRRSVEAFIVELRRAETLGLSYLVMHPGAALDSSEESALARVAAAFDEIHARCPRFACQVLLETTAGQGTTLGHRFEHLARILSLVSTPERLGVCFDTCHVFAAGYALAPVAEYKATFKAFEKLIGLKRLKLFHVNDSKKPFGSRVDRHEHLGRGHLGTEPFRLLVNDPRFRSRPMILETPKEGPDGEAMDPVNLSVLGGLLLKRTGAVVDN